MSPTANNRNFPVGQFPPDPLPLSGLRGDVIGIGGVMRQEAEDFVVEEIPAYEPSGTGEHLFLWIEKRGLSVKQVADGLQFEFVLPRGAYATSLLREFMLR